MRQVFYLRRLQLLVASQGAAQVVLLVLIPVIGEQYGIGVAGLAGLVALGTLCLMFAGPVWGLLSDRLGRRPVLLAGLTGALLGQALFVAVLASMAEQLLDSAVAVALLAASRVVYGSSAAAIYPSCQAWAVELGPPDRRLAILSSVSAAANSGRGLGPLLVLPALAAGGLWPLAWLVLLPLAGLLLAWKIPGRAHAKEEKSTAASAPQRGHWRLLAVAFLATTTIGQLQVAMGPSLADFYGLTAVQASSATALLLVGVALCSFAVQWQLARHLPTPELGLRMGSLLLGSGATVLALTLGGPGALAGLALFVIGVAFLVPGYSALLSGAQGTGQQGRVFGLLSLMHTGGYTAGYALGGWLYTQMPAQPLLGMSISAGLVAATALLATGFTKRRSTETEVTGAPST